MRITIAIALVSATICIAAIATPAADAAQVGYKNCYWDGTRPLCKGRCRPPWYERGSDSGGCFTGTRKHCCERYQIYRYDSPARKRR